jgi:hypothetical protein
MGHRRLIFTDEKYESKFSGRTNCPCMRKNFILAQLRRIALLVKEFVTLANVSYSMWRCVKRGK